MKRLFPKHILIVMLTAFLLISGYTAAHAATYDITIKNTGVTPAPVRGRSISLPIHVSTTFKGGDFLRYALYAELYKDGKLYDTSYSDTFSFSYSKPADAYISVETDPNDLRASYTLKVWLSKPNSKECYSQNTIVYDNITVQDSDYAIHNIVADKSQGSLGDSITWYVYCDGKGSLPAEEYDSSADLYSGTYTITNLTTGKKSVFEYLERGPGMVIEYQPTTAGLYNLSADFEIIKPNTQLRYTPYGVRLHFDSGLVNILGPSMPQIERIESSHNVIAAGGQNTWTVTASGGFGALEYRFDLYNGDALISEGEWTSSASHTVTLTDEGTYTVSVSVRDQNGDIGDSVNSPPVSVKDGMEIDRITVPAFCYAGEELSGAVSVSGSTEGAQYSWKVYQGETLLSSSGWTDSPVFSYTPQTAGSYTLSVNARNALGEQTAETRSHEIPVVAPICMDAIGSYGSCAPAVDRRWYGYSTGGYGKISYRFQLYQGESLFRDYGWFTQNYMHTSEYTDGGEYTMVVTARDENGRESEPKSETFTVTDAVPEVSSAALTGTLKKNHPLAWTAAFSSKGDGDFAYKAVLAHEGITEYESDWLTQEEFTAPHSYRATGNYTLTLYTKDEDGDEGVPYVLSFYVNSVPVVTSISCGSDVIKAGQDYLWEVETEDGEGTLEYQFSTYDHDHRGYIDYGLQLDKTYKWSTDPAFVYHSGSANSYFSYAISVAVRDADGDQSVTVFTPEFYITAAPVIHGIASENATCFIGKENTWTLDADDGVSPNHYYYSLYRGNKLYQTFPATANNTFSYTFTEPGNYALHAYAQDTECTSKTAISDTIVVTDPSPRIDAIVPEYALLGTGQSNTWTIYVKGEPEGLEYYYRLYKDGRLYETIGWKSENTVSHTFTESGRYAMQVRVFDSAGYSSSGISGITIVADAEATPVPATPTPSPTPTPIPTPTPTPLPSEVIVTLPNTQMLMTLPHGYTVSSYSYETSDSDYPALISKGQGNSGESLSSWISSLRTSGYTASLGSYGGMEGIYAWKQETGRSTYTGAFYYKALGNVTHSLIANRLTSVQLDNFREIILTIRAKPTATPTPDPAATPAPVIAMGTNKISIRSGQEVRVLFAAPKKGFYRFYTTGDKDTQGYLYNKEMTRLATDDDSGDRHNFLLSRELKAGEHVYVGIRFFSGESVPDSVSLTVEYLPYLPVAVGSNSVSIEAGKTTLRSFVAPETGLYQFYTTGDTDTLGYLYDENQNQITSDDDSGSGSNFQIKYELEAGELVGIGVRFYNSSTSGYASLNIAYTPSTTPAPTVTPTPTPTPTPAPVIDFVIDQNGVLERYKGEDAVVAVPQGVTGIGEYAFQDCSDVTSVELPEGVTSIGEFAFSNCSRLTRIFIPDSVTSIAGFAFYSCPEDMIIRSSSGAHARTYAADHGFTWEHDQHTLDVLAAVEPTCTETGLTEGSWCSSCGEIFTAQGIIDALGHTEVTDEAVAPTCTESGLTEGIHCDVCNEILTAQETIDALGHTEVTDEAVAPTCTESGLTEGIHCDVCNEILTAQETIDALGHTEVTDDAVAPTCTETGLTEGKHCDVCNEILLAQEIVDALGHTEVTDNAVAPTCTESGLTEGIHCSVCSEVLIAQEIVDALGHTEVTDDAVAPTCTESGLTEGIHCSVCNEILTAQEIVDALGHTEVTDDAVAPTCTESGLTEGIHCSVCSEILIAQETVPATGHSIRLDQNIYEIQIGGDSTEICVETACGHEADWIVHVPDNLTMTGRDGNTVTVSGSKPGTALLVFEVDDAMRNSASCRFVIHAEQQLVLPSALTAIDEEAFAGLSAEEIILSDQVEIIGARAFADCGNLALITLPDEVQIADDAFSGCGKLTILCAEGSTGQSYAATHQIPYFALRPSEAE